MQSSLTLGNFEGSVLGMQSILPSQGMPHNSVESVLHQGQKFGDYQSTAINFGIRRRCGRRGRPPRNISFVTHEGEMYSNMLEAPKNTYYFSIKQATSGEAPLDKEALIETIEFDDFRTQCTTRDELIHVFKSIAAKKGFKAIIPFTDRNNRLSTSTTFCCSLAGESIRKKSTNCPFKVTYVKNFND